MNHRDGSQGAEHEGSYRENSEYTPINLSKGFNGHVSVSSMNEVKQLSRKDSFSPLAHHSLVLLLLALTALGLLGALEYGVRVLPSVSFDINHSISNFTLDRRQADGASPTANPALGDTNSDPNADGAAATTFPTGVPPAGSFLNAAGTTSTLPPAPHTTSDAYVPGDGTTVLLPPNIASITAGAGPTPGSNSGGTWSGVQSGSNGGSVAATNANGVSGTKSLEGSLIIIPGINGGTPTVMLVNPTALDAGATSPTSSMGPDAAQGNGPMLQSSLPLQLIEEPTNYFIAVYVPVLIAVVLRIYAGWVFRYTKLMDAFFMLSQPEGAPIHHFLWLEHLSAESWMAPWHAFQARRWALLWTAMVYASTQLLTPFASEVTSIHYSTYYFHVGESIGFVRGHAVWINYIVVRVLQGLLALLFLQVIVVWVLLRFSRSGIRNNPASISTIASIFGHPATTSDFARVDQWADKKSTIEHFDDQCYRIQSYTGTDGNECIGVVPIGRAAPNPLGYDTTNTHHFKKEPSRSIARKDAVNLFLITAATLVLLGIIITYTVTSAPTAFEKFMDSQSFGPRFMLSALALLLKSPLLSLSARTVASVPFARLESKPRTAKLDITDPVPLTPLGTIAYALKRRAWFSASLGIVSGLFVEILLILMPGVPFQAQQYYDAARASWFGSIGCLVLILFVVIVGWFRLCFKGGAKWPKSPTTIGALAMYVAGTSMTLDAAVEGSVSAHGQLFNFSQRRDRWVVEYAETIGNECVDNGEAALEHHSTCQSAFGQRVSPHREIVESSSMQGIPPPPIRYGHDTWQDAGQATYHPGKYHAGTLHDRHFSNASYDASRTARNITPQQGTYPGRPRYQSVPNEAQ